jgi:N-acetylglucosaminyl-diphospho-decaprenol L-rhamnosyltransferase
VSADSDGSERLAVIVVSYNSAHWLRRCLSTLYERAGHLQMEVVVVDSGSRDDTQGLVQREFPAVHLVVTENRGFAAANNRGLQSLRGVRADWILFLNPDTELVDGTLADLISAVGRRPAVGLSGVRQVTPDGEVFPTIRRFPNALRSLFEALGAERAPFRASWLGERELDLSRYEHEVPCDWTTGAFMLVRGEVIESVGYMDERFFFYCEETDYCLRVHQAGWEIRHFPQLTIVHHANKAGWDPRLAAQAAYARRQYMAKHFSPVHRAAGFGALAIGYGLRAVVGRHGEANEGRKRCARAALAMLVGRMPPPFGAPPPQAMRPRRLATSREVLREPLDPP